MKKKLKFFVSTENKILLHLKRYLKVDAAKRVPKEVTQFGIANSLDSPRGSVSRALGNLITKNFVEEKLCRVLDSKRRMNAYFITWEGRTQAEALENKIATELVDAKLDDGKITEVTLSEALELSDFGLSITELLRILEKYGYYDPKTHKPETEPEGPQPSEVRTKPLGEAAAVSEPDYDVAVQAAAVREAVPPEIFVKEPPPFMKVPEVYTFYGRSKELEVYPSLLEEYPIFIIEGMAGIGKTTLAAKILKHFDSSWKLFWFKLQDWDTSKSIIEELAEFFNKYGHKDLLRELESTRPELDMYKITKIIVQEFNSMKAMCVIDDFHRASDSVQQLFSGLIEHLDSKLLMHFMFLTRTHLPVYDQRDIALKKIVYVAKLQGLDRESSKEMLGDKTLEKDFNRIYSLTGGHPLALELIKNSGQVDDISDMMNFINEQVYQKLDPEEKALFMSISVHRKPVPTHGFLIDDEADFETIDRLINKTLLLEMEPGKYYVHDIVREFFYSRLIGKQRNNYHFHAAEYYSQDISEDLNVLEAVYHYINADKQDLAAELMVNRAPILIRRGYLDEAMSILTKFDSNVSPEYLAKLNNLRGDIMNTWGEWDNVFEYYWQCCFLAWFEKEKIEKPELLDEIGLIGWKPLEVEAAESNLAHSLEVLKTSRDQEGIIEIENSIGWLKWMIGNFDEAERIYKKLYEKLVSNKDTLGSAKILIKLGNVYWGKDDLDLSLEHYHKGLELFQSISNDHGVVRSFSLIARIHIERGDYPKADENLLKGFKISNERYFKKGLAYALLHNVQNLIIQNQHEEGSKELKKALAAFETLSDPLGTAYCYALEGYLYNLSKEPEKAINHIDMALHYLHGFLMPYYKSKLYTELSHLYKSIGDTETAKEAMEYAKNKLELQ
ncbi:MAG: tetratricopeptide repeat protein [Thermoplasmata archaeon]|nr:MAG: tetratricopeptide repeat protein [Thermoplasmata archaeon]